MLIVSRRGTNISYTQGTNVSITRNRAIFFISTSSCVSTRAIRHILRTVRSTSTRTTIFNNIYRPTSTTPGHIRRLVDPGTNAFNTHSPRLLFRSGTRPCTYHTTFSHRLLGHRNVHFTPNLTLNRSIIFRFTTCTLTHEAIIVPSGFCRCIVRDRSTARRFGDTRTHTGGLSTRVGVLRRILRS